MHMQHPAQDEPYGAVLVTPLATEAQVALEPTRSPRGVDLVSIARVGRVLAPILSLLLPLRYVRASRPYNVLVVHLVPSR